VPGAPAAPVRKHEAPSRAVPIIRRAMEGMGDEDGWVSLGVIGQRLGNMAPDFDSRTYGAGKLSDVIRRSGAFVMEKDEANHMRVRPKKGDGRGSANGNGEAEAPAEPAEEPAETPEKAKAKPKSRARGRSRAKPKAETEG